MVIKIKQEFRNIKEESFKEMNFFCLFQISPYDTNKIDQKNIIHKEEKEKKEDYRKYD